MKKKLHVLLFISTLFQFAGAQVENPVKWHFTSKKGLKTNEFIIQWKAKIDKGWYVYGLGPYEIAPATRLEIQQISGAELLGKPTGLHEKQKDDEYIGKYGYYVGEAVFEQKVKLSSSTAFIKGLVEYSTCSLESGMCLPPKEVEFTFEIKDTKSSDLVKQSSSVSKTDTTQADTKKQIQSDSVTTVRADDNADAIFINKTEAVNSSLWAVFILSFLSGIVALITPCVFPMIPMTVTFFLKSGKNKTQAIAKALTYGLSIILIYTIIGTIVAKLAGPEAANFLSTHWLPNLVFFGVFLIFAFSFLGAFEITLPSSWVNAADRGSDKGGWYGVFFMAFTLVLVSFSCTGPIVGSILVQSAGGATLLPMIGMFGFSLAFALPFTLFALFPSWLKVLPKSGGWLNDVKVSLGFLELGLAFKFFSLADQAYHWNILSREINLALWIAIGTAWTLYLWQKLPLYVYEKPLSVTKLIVGIVVFAFTIYLLPGLWGAPLKPLSGYLPPSSDLGYSYQNFVGSSYTQQSINHDKELCSTPSYSDFLHFPHGLKGYFILDEALECAKNTGKPVFVDFTGHGCVNCREMEANIWSEPSILKSLKEDFIKVALYVDDKTELPEIKWYISTYDQKLKTSIGKQNADLQITKYKTNAQPYYLILDSDGNVVSGPQTYTNDISVFKTFLDRGKKSTLP